MSDFFNSSSGDLHKPVDATSRKEEIIQRVKSELAVAQAQELINKTHDKCFAKCVPKPGPAFTDAEQTCMKRCIGRYMDAFNIVSKTYVTRINEEQESRSALVPY